MHTPLVPYSQGNLNLSASTNWQFQSGSSITASGILLTGAMQIQGTQATGTFQTSLLPCVDVPQPVAFTGTYNGTLTLQ